MATQGQAGGNGQAGQAGGAADNSQGKLSGEALLAELDRLRAENAKLQAQASTRGIKCKAKTGISGKTNKPYAGVQVSGPFPPLYLSGGTAASLAADLEGFGKALRGAVDELAKLQAPKGQA